MIDPSIVVEGHDPLTSSPLYEGEAGELLGGGRWKSKRIFVTSPRAGDGKTRTAFNLAAAFAGGGKSVLLAELNFTHPRFRTVLGNLRFRNGIDCVTRGTATPREGIFSVHPSGLETRGLEAAGPGKTGLETALHITAVRTAVPEARLDGCLLHLNDFLDWAAERYELVVLDCPSVLSPEWDRWFHAFVGEALLVVREDRTPVVDVRNAARLLDQHLTGAWLNRSQESSLGLEPARETSRMAVRGMAARGMAVQSMPAEMMAAVAAPGIAAEERGSQRSFESLRNLSTLLMHASGGTGESTRHRE
jgi:MinD-like ATPase involved in chromosome partitioning or flagellar assembly